MDCMLYRVRNGRLSFRRAMDRCLLSDFVPDVLSDREENPELVIWEGEDPDHIASMLIKRSGFVLRFFNADTLPGSAILAGRDWN